MEKFFNTVRGLGLNVVRSAGWAACAAELPTN